ncbi:MAG TPA: hypothetical protein VNR00_17400 [Opitutus sp.]|nr:hypothetical protein [Opitutus sp.]
MKRSPEELEKLIHETLRALPDRRAPRSLEARVLAAIEARSALPWWRHSFADWPLAARIGFVALSTAIAAAMVAALMWLSGNVDTSQLGSTLANRIGWIDGLQQALAGLRDFASLVIRSIPTGWLYGALAGFVGVYALLFGLGATAYRALYQQSR